MARKKTARQRGLDVYRRMGWGGNDNLRKVDEDAWRFTTDFLFGEIWSRPGLSLRERELVTLVALIAMEAEGITTHMRNARHLGISLDEIKEVILQVMYYLGQPKGFLALRRLKQVKDETAMTKKRAKRK